MDTLHSSTTTTTTTIEQPMDKKLRISWGKKAIPLRNSTLFNKAKHSEEWHQAIDATAGVLHPSDSKFPYGFLRDHTESYLKKKGKISQADADIRLAILITTHEARDVAVAAAAHAITAKSLRTLLHADLNVMHGSYWGLKMWLQCLIAANDGNPASVTELEALWARKLLPFATQGQRAAEWYLAGVCRILREMALPNMEIVPEFSMLMKRAISDYALRLEDLRLRNNWSAAYDTVLWMIELARTSPVTTPPGHLLPEHILDSQFPVWRVWTLWEPDADRIKHLAGCDNNRLAAVSDLVALEGPDMIAGTAKTLRDGLIARYNGEKSLVKWRGIVVEFPERTRESLKAILGRAAQQLKMALTDTSSVHIAKLELFRYLTIAQPITTNTLDVFEATCNIPYTPENDIYHAVREILQDRDRIGGQHILALQLLIHALDDERSVDLRSILLQDWLRIGIENCVKECQEAVRTHIDTGLPWTDMALEYHAFCTKVKASERHWPKEYQTMKIHPQWPTSDDLKIVSEIQEAVQAQELNLNQVAKIGTDKTYDATETITSPSIPSSSVEENESPQNPLGEYVKAYCIDRVLGQSEMSQSARSTMEAMIRIWIDTSKPQSDTERRTLAIMTSKIVGRNSSLRCECLADIAIMNSSNTSVTTLTGILLKSESSSYQAIYDLTDLLSKDPTWEQCWKDVLFQWLHRESRTREVPRQDILEHSLRTMPVATWLMFMQNIWSLSGKKQASNTVLPAIIEPALLQWVLKLSDYTGTLVRLETVLGQGSEPLWYISTCYAWSKQMTAILSCLQKTEGKPSEILMQRMVGKLKNKAKIVLDIMHCVLDLSIATPEAIEICYRVWDAKHDGLDIPGLPSTSIQTQRPGSSKHVVARKAVPANSAPCETDQANTKATSIQKIPTTRRAVPIAVVEIMVAGWIQSDEISEHDKTAIASVAGILEMCVEWFSVETWNLKLEEATRFWEGIENEILAETARLENLTKILRAKDPKGTALLLEELGIANNSLLDNEMDNIPLELIDTVERVGEDEVEISFSLHHFTDLQRGAMGIPAGANSFLLRLTFSAMDTTPPEFCVHFNNDKGLDTLEHRTWRCSSDSKTPRENICKTPQTAFAWQLQHIIHTQLRIGNTSIADLHKRIKLKISCLGHTCVTCDISLHKSSRAHIRRSVPCNIMSCARLWYALPLDVRIPEIRNDIYVVDLMLMSVHAAAMSGRPELLPACPIRNMEAVKAILNSLPSMTVISHAVNISAVLRSYHKDAETLISWACVQHRGYIASATGLCKVPNMPAGTHQFVLANAAPKLESDFLSRLPRANTKTSVLFHGTTFDRLPAILTQGLRVCSGTSLQQTGAAHGKGIYLAEEPATSLTYSSIATSWRNSGLANMRLLLGCEVVSGVDRSVTSGIHVITDQMGVMVRYIFLLTGSVSAPIANHVVPAMASGMSALRTGAV